tara:strand:+ start:1076 stop:1294 length:219 start_codon:yes stop_codon:yes gene_type:complete
MPAEALDHDARLYADREGAGETKVAHLRVLQLVEHHIPWLDVSVQHSVAMQVGNALRGLVRDPVGQRCRDML